MLKFFKKNNDRNKKTERFKNSFHKLKETLKKRKQDIQVVYEELNSYTVNGELFNVGDKVITKSNECDSYNVGHISFFYDNDGKWSNCITYVKLPDGTTIGVMGIIKHYTEELENTIKNLKPLEQWNYFVEEPYKYTEDEMVKKQKSYDRLKKFKEITF